MSDDENINPIVVDDDVQEDSDLVDVVVDDDGNEWFPLYTDDDELGQGVTSGIVMNAPIKVILENAFNSDRVQGVVINPFSEKMILSKQAVEIILAKWEDDEKEAE